MTSVGPQILLDPVGDAPVPEGYHLVDSEVAFLQRALDPQWLFVRGRRLCEWAERFYQARGVSTQYALSTSRKLMEVCPTLSDEQAQQIAARLDDLGAELHAASLADVLLRLHPQGRWHELLSEEHAAWWLLWLEETRVPPAEEVLLREQARLWQQEAAELLRPAYAVHTGSEASLLLQEWLGLTEREKLSSDLAPFPLDLPRRWRTKISEAATKWYVQGAHDPLAYLESSGNSRYAKQVVAEAGYSYFVHHPGDLTRPAATTLVRYLPFDKKQQLDRITPAPDPGDLDVQLPVEAALRWVVDRYVPYRKWVADYGNDGQRARADTLARQFAHWLLRSYPLALQDPAFRKHLVFRHVRTIAEPRRVTLLVVLDGLGWADALSLDGYAQQASWRFSRHELEPMLGALPTITQFAKPAILKGERSSLASGGARGLADVAEVLPEGNIPVERLREAHPGDYLIWRINEPDKTYHERYDSETIQKDVDSELRNLAEKIVTAVQSVEPGIPVLVAVTSDHGRLMGESRRCHQVPTGMQAKGRAAWGDSAISFPGDGYVIDEDAGLIYLHAERYGLPSDVAVPLDADAFVDKGGGGPVERYSHGGIYPEEVVVPWLVYARDVPTPRVEADATGSGRAGESGRLQLVVRNLEEQPIVAQALILHRNDQPWEQLPIEQQVAALSEVKTELLVPTWLDDEQWRHVRAVLAVQSGGLEFEQDVRLSVQTRQMYRRANLLEELR